MFKKMLVPTDFSPCSDRAFAFALELARHYGGSIQLLHVMTQVEGDSYSPLRYSPEAQARHDSPDTLIYEHLVKKIAAFDTEGVVVEPAKQRGRAVAPTVLRDAERYGFDLIVMGTHGRQGVKHFVVGSIAEDIMRHADCDVLIVPENTAPVTQKVRRLLVPIDFSGYSSKAIQTARQLASHFGARIDLLHVVEPLPFPLSISGLLTTQDLIPQIRKDARKRLERLVGESGGPDVDVELVVERGHAASKIVDFAEENETNLIVAARYGLSGVERFLLGSVTERVIRTAPCPVLILNTPATSPETAKRRAAAAASPEQTLDA